jgi:hypothetical protein
MCHVRCLCHTPSSPMPEMAQSLTLPSDSQRHIRPCRRPAQLSTAVFCNSRDIFVPFTKCTLQTSRKPEKAEEGSGTLAAAGPGSCGMSPRGGSAPAGGSSRQASRMGPGERLRGSSPAGGTGWVAETPSCGSWRGREVGVGVGEGRRGRRGGRGGRGAGGVRAGGEDAEQMRSRRGSAGLLTWAAEAGEEAQRTGRRVGQGWVGGVGSM